MLLRKFRTDRSGNVAIIMAVALTGVASVIALAVDFQRSVVAEQTLQNTLDATSLAAARAFQGKNATDESVKQEAEAFFAGNIALTNLSLNCPKPTLVIDKKAGTVRASAVCSLPTTAAGLFNVEQMKVGRSSTASIEITRLDLALMLDVSGSMAGDKIIDLKAAASDAIDMLITDQSGDRVRIAFNTYSTAINVGSYAKAVKGSNYDAKSPLKDCVTERDGSARFDEDKPGVSAWMQEKAKSTDGKVMSCPKSSIQPLTFNKTDLKNQIGKLKADGWTAGHLGVAWAWYLISPEWKNIWPAASEPMAYDEKDALKAVILMTDGEFNTHYQKGQGNSDKQSEKLCDNMKKEGVIIYSVAFQAPKKGKAVLKTCASSADHFFDAANGTELKAAYANIASQLQNLRIAK